MAVVETTTLLSMVALSVVVDLEEIRQEGARAMKGMRTYPGVGHGSIRHLPVKVGDRPLVGDKAGLAQQLFLTLAEEPQDEHLRAFAEGALSATEARPDFPNRIIDESDKDNKPLFRLMYLAHDILENALYG